MVEMMLTIKKVNHHDFLNAAKKLHRESLIYCQLRSPLLGRLYPFNHNEVFRHIEAKISAGLRYLSPNVFLNQL